MTLTTTYLAALLFLAWSTGIASATTLRAYALRSTERDRAARDAAKDRHPAYSRGRRVL